MPQHAVLTELAVRATKPPERGTVTIWDGALKHFGLRVSQGGTKSFIVLLGSGHRQAIGRFPTISVAEGRAKAKRILADRVLGKHQPQAITWEAAAEQFLAASKRKNRPSTQAEYARILARYFPFGAKRLSEISKNDIARKLDRLNSTPSQQSHALVCVKVLFHWALTSGYLDHNPAAGFSPAKMASRSRVLSDDELRSIWLVCSLDRAALIDNSETDLATQPVLSADFCAVVKLLILTGARRGEIAGLTGPMVDFETQTITLPTTLTKNKREHRFPLGPLAERLLRAYHRDGLLFPGRGTDNPFSGWSKCKSEFDKACPIMQWTLHDLRRTFATRLAALGVPIHVTEKLLNHVTGTISGVAAIYNRHSYMNEMRQAVGAYEAHLVALCEN